MQIPQVQSRSCKLESLLLGTGISCYMPFCAFHGWVSGSQKHLLSGDVNITVWPNALTGPFHKAWHRWCQICLASPPFLLFSWGPWLLQFPLSSYPVEPLIRQPSSRPSYTVTGEAGSNSNERGWEGHSCVVSLPKATPVALNNKNALPYPLRSGLANSPD